MSQERVRNIPINNRVVDLQPTACTALATLQERRAGVVPVPRFGFTLRVSIYGLARRDVTASGPCMSNTSPRWHVDRPI
jgi:hypothetical protein